MCGRLASAGDRGPRRTLPLISVNCYPQKLNIMRHAGHAAPCSRHLISCIDCYTPPLFLPLRYLRNVLKPSIRHTASLWRSLKCASVTVTMAKSRPYPSNSALRRSSAPVFASERAGFDDINSRGRLHGLGGQRSQV